MLKRLIPAAFVLAAAALPAQAGSSIWNWYLFPAVASAPGKGGTYFRTDLSLQNPYASRAVSVRVQFWQAGIDNTGASAQARTYTIPPGGTLALQDVVAKELGRGGGGALLVESQSLDGAYFAAASRTYTASPAGAGTYGLAEPGQWYVAGQKTRTLLPGIKTGGGFRTNTGAANASPVPIALRLEVLDAGGAVRATRDVTVPPYSSTQLAVDDLVAQLPAGSLSWTCLSEGRTPTEIQWSAYATPIDNASGDSTYVSDSVDNFFLTHQNSHDMTGIWQGTHTGTYAGIAGTAPTKVLVLQNGPYLAIATYGAFDLQTTFSIGFEDHGRIELHGGSTQLACLTDTSVTTGTTTGTSWNGTIRGTGCWGEVQYSYTKVATLSRPEVERLSASLPVTASAVLPEGHAPGRIPPER